METDAARTVEEAILYQDSDEFLTSRPFEDHMIPKTPRVRVTPERMKVGDDTYVLDGVTGISLISPLERISRSTLTKKIIYWTWFWISFVPLGYYCYVQRGQAASWAGMFPWIVFCGVPYVLAKLATNRDEKQRYHKAEITLSQAGRSMQIFVGAFRKEPRWISQERDLWKGGMTEADREKVYKQRTEYFKQSVARTQRIAEALGQAIQHKQAANSK